MSHSEKTYLVDGMSCKNCKAHVESSISNLEGIKEVNADFVTGQVVVKGSHLDDIAIRQTVEKAGYRFNGEMETMHPGSDLWFS